MDDRAAPQHDPLEMVIATEAADWLLRLDEDSSARCREEFSSWLKRSPQHVESFLMTSATVAGLRKIDPARAIDVHSLLQETNGNVLSMADAQSTPPRISQARTVSRRSWLGFAAAATLAALVASPFLIQSIANRDGYQTGAGEQRSLQLDDGSLIHLNTRSRVQVSYSENERKIALLEGEALFVVARDPRRPFRVQAGGAVIQAVGTEFNVYRQASRTTVSVLEGRVKVSSPGNSSPLLEAGGQASVLGNGRILEQARADIESAVAWRQRRLVFKRERLDAIAAEFNRYNRTTLNVQSPAAQRRLTGTFNSNEPEAFVRFLSDDPALEVLRRETEITIRVRPGQR